MTWLEGLNLVATGAAAAAWTYVVRRTSYEAGRRCERAETEKWEARFFKAAAMVEFLTALLPPQHRAIAQQGFRRLFGEEIAKHAQPKADA